MQSPNLLLHSTLYISLNSTQSSTTLHGSLILLEGSEPSWPSLISHTECTGISVAGKRRQNSLVATWVKLRVFIAHRKRQKLPNSEFWAGWQLITNDSVPCSRNSPTNGCCTCVCVCVSVCNIACAAIGERCANGRCLLPRERCDGVNDCGDYSDETNCSMFMCLTIDIDEFSFSP